MTSRVDVDVAGRRVSVSNLDKVLWPRLGRTKGWMIDYYTSVAADSSPNLRSHPLTRIAFPTGSTPCTGTRHVRRRIPGGWKR